MHASTTIAIDSSSKAVSIKASAASIAEYAIHWTLCTAGTGGTRRWRFFIWVFDINAVVYWLFCFWNGPKTVVWHRGCCAVWNVVMSLFSARKSFAVITVLQLYEGKRFLVSFQSLPSLYFLFFPSNPRKPVLSAPTCLANVQGAEAKLCVTYAPGKKKRAHYR